MAAQQVAQPRVPHREDDHPAALHRILVVDDNVDSADSMGLILKYLGADVHVVNDGATALQALGSFRPTIMLLDIGMPKMDGYEVARRVRQTPEGRDVTLIALTGWGQHEDRKKSKAAGFDHHFVKPVEIAMLQELISTLPHRARSSSLQGS